MKLKSLLLEREQYYLNTLNPEYNILKQAGSSLGFKLSQETKIKMSNAKKGLSSPKKDKKLSEDTKLLIKLNNAKNKKVYLYSPSKILLKEFISINEASIYTGITRSRISRACVSHKCMDNKYIFSFIQLIN